VASDYFVAAEPGDSEAIEKFADVMAAQLDVADAGTRLEIARKLAPCRRTPVKLLAKFESIDWETGDYVLEHALAYAPRDLAPAVSGGGRRAVAVAKRRDLDYQLVRALAESNEVDVLIALARNGAAQLEGPALARLLAVARRRAEGENERVLAEALLERRPVRVEMASLFLQARPDQRVDILLAAQRMQLARPPVGPPPDSTTLEELELTAVARQPARFVAVLAQALDCEPDLAQRIVDDESGEPLAVALAALGAVNEVLVRVLISNDLLAGASYRRIQALARLNSALNRNAAMTVIAALRDGFVRRPYGQSPTDAGTAGGASRSVTGRQASRPASPPQHAREMTAASVSLPRSTAKGC
jgi:uncharacterized protein (DUF2336 family)